MATCSNILAWKIPWTQEPGGLQSMGSQRVGQDWVTEHAHIGEYCKDYLSNMSSIFSITVTHGSRRVTGILSETLSCLEMLHTQTPPHIGNCTELETFFPTILSHHYSEFDNISVLINNRASASPLWRAECSGAFRDAGGKKWPEAKYRGTNNLDTQVLAFGRIPPPFPFHI